MKTVTEQALVTGSLDEVWMLVTDARYFQEWYAFGGASIDLRPGGDMTMRWDEHGTFHAVVETVTPPRLFSFRWRYESGPVVTITLDPVGADTTLVRIVESGELEDAAQSALAWRNGLRALSEIAKARKTESST